MNRKSITIDNTVVSNTDQTDFPLLISLASDSDLSADAQTDGDDIFFTDSNGAKIPHEIERYVSGTGELKAWVKVPTLSASTDTVLYMYYGNSTTTSQQNKTSVWSAFRSVFHMNDATTSTVGDSATLGNTGTKTSADNPIEADAKIGKGQTFDSGDEIPTFGSSLSPVGDRTISAWINISDTTRRGILGTRPSTATEGFSFVVNRTTAGNLTYFHPGGSLVEIAGGISTSTWYYVSVTLDSVGDVAELFVNGTSIGSQGTFSAESTSTYNGMIGDEKDNNAGSFVGTMDEVRITTSVLSDDWLKTEYNNQNSPGTYQTLGAEASSTANAILGGATTVNANFTITAGGLDVSSSNYALNVGGNWSNAGTFNARAGTVTLNTGTTATVGGGPTTFYNLTITHTSAKEVNFSTTAAHIIHVTNAFTVTGTAADQLIKLYSTSGSTKWHFHPTGTASVTYADVKDGGCETGSINITPTNSNNGGNNESCWIFGNYLTFSLGSYSINFGTLTTSAAGTGTHTISAATNATGGFAITYLGATLTNLLNGSYTIPVYTSSASSPGTAGFGINLKNNATPDIGAEPTTNSGTCGIASGYNTADQYTFVASANTTITSVSAAANCVYTASYVANISSTTAAGPYSTAITYIVTGTF